MKTNHGDRSQMYVGLHVTYLLFLFNQNRNMLKFYWKDVLGIEFRWGARFSTTVQTAAGAHLASYTMGTGSFPGVERPVRGANHQLPSRAEVKEKVELYLYFSLWVFVACSRVNFTFYLYQISISRKPFLCGFTITHAERWYDEANSRVLIAKTLGIWRLFKQT